MQRGGVASLRVAAVDVVGAAQLLHPRQAALLGCVQQGGVSTQQVLDVGVAVLDQVQRRVPISVLLGGVGTVLGGGVEQSVFNETGVEADGRDDGGGGGGEASHTLETVCLSVS